MTFSLENKLAPLTGEIRELREREKESNYFLICFITWIKYLSTKNIRSISFCQINWLSR